MTVVSAAISYCLWRGARAVAGKRAIEDMPTALVRSAAQGYTELRGMAALMAGEPILAPASLRACVWYRYRIEHRDSGHGRNGRAHEWTTTEHGTSDSLFYLTDTSGSCVVDPDGAEVRAARCDHWYGNTRIPGHFDARDATWFARLGAGLIMRYRYTEFLIEPGAALYVLGDFMTHGGTDPVPVDHDAAIARRLREWKRDRTSLLRRFDRNGDGDLDPVEWDAARNAAEREVVAEEQQAAGAPPVDVIGRTGDRRRPCIIAAGTEDTLVAQQLRTAWTAFGIGLSLAGGVLWAVLTRLAPH